MARCAALHWSIEHLLHEWALALGEAIDLSTHKTYGSHLNSYLNFVLLHDLPVEPTDHTLSLYTVYSVHYIKLDSIDSYLSGICHQLEPYFPNVQEARGSMLVCRTLRGCKCMKGTAVWHKHTLTLDDLGRIIIYYQLSTQHDDLLFVMGFLTGFFALMHLGELSFPNDRSLWDWHKVTWRDSVELNDDFYGFWLPHHKADPYFKGNQVIIHKEQFRHNPLYHFMRYLESWDHLFPISSPLWITESGSMPTQSFYISRFHLFFDSSIGGQLMRASGATSLVEHSIPPSIIQPLGRWSSTAFLIYIRKSPALIQALLYSSQHTSRMTSTSSCAGRSVSPG